MPNCSACSLAVEWLRSCYRGRWRLFRGHPEILTPGRYVFLPDGWPHCTTIHWMGSANWMRGQEEEVFPFLGEASNSGWNNGEIFTDLPPAAILGDIDCLASGDIWPMGPGTRTLVGGWDSRCFHLDDSALPVGQVNDFDIAVRTNQATYAGILDVLDTDRAAAKVALQSFLGADAAITDFGASVSGFPAALVGVTDSWTVALVASGANPEQTGTAGMYAGQWLVNEGSYGSAPTWIDSATGLLERVAAAGSVATKPIILVGHSYAAAVAAMAAVQLAVGIPARQIKILTFGMPRPGDSRFNALSGTVKAIHFANVDDPVPLLAPTKSELWPLQSLIAGDYLAAWDEWQAPNVHNWLADDGSITETQPWRIAFEELLAYAGNAVADVPMPTFPAHDIKEYARRLLLTSP